MSGLVNVSYISLPINLLYKERSSIKAPSSLDNLRCCSIGVFIGLHPSMPESCNAQSILSFIETYALCTSSYLKPQKVL